MLSDLLQLPDPTEAGAWRAEVVASTRSGNRNLAAAAVAALYYEFGTSTARMVWCDGPFQAVAMAVLLREAMASDLWGKASWPDVFYEVLEPKIVPIAKGISTQHDSKEPIRKVILALKDQFEQYGTREAESSQDLISRIKQDLTRDGRDSTRLQLRAQQVVRWHSFRRQSEFMGYLTNDQRRSYEQGQGLSRQAGWQLHSVIQRALTEFSEITRQFEQTLFWFPWQAQLLDLYAAQRIRGGEISTEMDAWTQLALHCSGAIFCEGLCFVVDKPKSIVCDHRHRLENERGPAVEFADGFAAYALGGLPVPRYVIEPGEWLTIDMVLGEQNAEIRRVMLERYGFERFVNEGYARLMHSDAYGELYALDEWLARPEERPALLMADDTVARFIRVRNSTPGPDGSFKYYALRVPPDMVRARQAIAWTFGMEEDEYDPSRQT